MATATSTEPGIPSLVKGIVNDVGALVKQQIEFAKSEIRMDLKRTGEASKLLAVGSGVAAVGALVLTFMLVQLLSWLAPTLPLWACYAIVGGLILATGAALILMGKKRFDSFNPLPEQTAQSLKENIEWMTNSK